MSPRGLGPARAEGGHLRPSVPALLERAPAEEAARACAGPHASPYSGTATASPQFAEAMLDCDFNGKSDRPAHLPSLRLSLGIGATMVVSGVPLLEPSRGSYKGAVCV